MTWGGRAMQFGIGRPTRRQPRSRRAFRGLAVEPLESRALLTAVIMTNQEQLLLELVNRARANPAAEAVRYGIDLNADLDPETISPDPKQPLAPNQALVNTARGHSQDMLDFDYFAHNSPRGDGPGDRAKEAGYSGTVGENIAWYGSPSQLQQDLEVYRRHEALFLSPPHRENMMAAGYRELGNGIKYGEFEGLAAIMVTENFGNRRGEYFITGIAYTDRVQADNFYTIGEGLGAITITATRHRDGLTFSTTTGPSGGYGLEVPTGAYTVTATGSALSGPMVVRDVVVLSQNQKVDFNTRSSGLGSVSGLVFHDLDRDQVRDAGEPLLSGQTIYLDYDDSGERSPDETSITTDASGSFRLEGLRTGIYRFRHEVPAGWEASAPTNGQSLVNLLPSQNRTGLLFGAYLVNSTPVAVDDQFQTEQGQSVTIDVFGNDYDIDGSLVPESTRILVAAQHGDVRLDRSSGQLVYFPAEEFVGQDYFEYTIDDDAGLTSNVARVDLEVTPGPGLDWQNPAGRFDVNADTYLSPIDALLILNDLNARGARRLPAAQPDRPPPFIDVSGDGFVTPIDALLVLNELNRVFVAPRFASVAEGEMVPPASLAAAVLFPPTRFEMEADRSPDASHSPSDGQKADLARRLVPFEASRLEPTPQILSDEPLAQSDSTLSPEDVDRVFFMILE